VTELKDVLALSKQGRITGNSRFLKLFKACVV